MIHGANESFNLDFMNASRTIGFVSLVFVTCIVRAQESKMMDSLRNSINNMHYSFSGSRNELPRKSDIISNLAKLDRLSDSIKVITWVDSMRYRIDKKYNAQKAKINRKMDSLRGFSLPISQLQSKLDKIQRRQSALLNELKEKQTALETKIAKRYSDWKISVKSKLKLDSFGIKMPNTELPGLPNSQAPVTKLKVPGTKLRLPQNSKLPGIPPMPALGQQDFSSLKMSKDLKKIGGSLSLPNTAQLKQWESQVPALKELNNLKAQGASYRNAFKDPDKAIDKAVGSINELSVLKKELSNTDQIKTNEAVQLAQNMKDPEKMQAQTVKMAVDHFAGKEQELNEAMLSMNKYKKKYESLPSLEDAKKSFWPRNGLRGAPFRERFRPGFNLGFRTSKDTVVFDLFPTVSYRISGRIEAGVGGIYRVRVLTRPYGIDQHASNTWGGSAFVVVKTFKATFLRLEADANSYRKASTTDGTVVQSWRWTYLSGLQVNFSISKNLFGNVQTLYSFDHKLKDGIPDRLIMRLGVQYMLPAKRRD